VSALPLADGPAYYFGSTVMTFALPYGAFIAAAVALYFLFRANHSSPRLKYWSDGRIASVSTREPGPAPAPPVASVLSEGPETAVPPGVLLPDGAVPSVIPETFEPETAAPETAAPETAAPETAAPPQTDGGQG
jgi:hypothetical protein